MFQKIIKMCLLMICMCCTAYGDEDQLNKCYLSHKNVEIS